MSYVPVGCFHDLRVGGRPLPELISSYRHNIDWANINVIVGYCARDTWKRQYPVFGLQFYAECWSGPFGHLTYDKDGLSWNGCWEGVGKGWNNFVYAFKSMYFKGFRDQSYKKMVVESESKALRFGTIPWNPCSRSYLIFIHFWTWVPLRGDAEPTAGEYGIS